MSKPRYYRIEDRAGEADIMIYGVIGESWFEESVTARQLVVDIRDLEKKHQRINVRINSPGGSVFDGLAIFNALQSSTAEVHTWNDGLAASMGAVLLMAGEKVHAARNSLMMLHSPSTGVWGNAREIQQTLSTLDKVQNSLVECLLTRSTKTREEIIGSYFDYSDHWLSAEEAQQEGFVDELSGSKAEVSRKVAALDYQELVARFGELVPEEKRKGKLVAFFENLFTPTIDRTTTEEISTKDMDIKTLQAALSLGEGATENEVLDRIRQMATDLATEKAAREKAQKDLNDASAAKAQAEKELEEYKKKPGAAPATVDVETDNLEVKDQADSFTEALAYCQSVLKK